jgi:hypothetical protein
MLPRFYIRSRPARRGIDPFTLIGRQWVGSGGFGLDQQFVQGVARTWGRLDDQATVTDCQADHGTGLKVQLIQKDRWYGQRDRSADLAKTRGMYKYSFS